MKKRILNTVIAFVMVLSICSVFCLTARPVAAASKSKTTYMTSMAVEQEGSGRYEKIGKYYFWTKRYMSTSLKCATSTSGKGKTLHTAKGANEISPYIVTDGKQVYYAVNEYYGEGGEPIKATLYKTSINGKKKKLNTISSEAEPYAYYNGKLYYGVRVNKSDQYIKMALYVYDTAKKTAKKLKNNFAGYSGYGKYITYRNQANDKKYIYDVTTGKSKKLPSGEGMVVYGKNVYYYTQSRDIVTAVKKCNLSGKGSKTIKKLNDGLYLKYFGRTVAHFINFGEGWGSWKLTYKTKKLTKVHS